MAKTKDLFAQLEPLAFRGIEVPILGRQVGFRHELAPHKFQFRDQEFPEPTGLAALTFRYRVAMREGIAKGPYENLFLKVLRKFWDAFRDRKPGPLRDPIHGTFRALPSSYSEDLDVARRDGVDLEIDFVHAPELDEVVTAAEGLVSVQAINHNAGVLEWQVTKQEYQQEEHKKAMVDPFSAIEGLFDQIGLIGAQAAARLDKFADKMDRVTEAIDRIEDPSLFAIRDSAQNLRDAAVRLHDKVTDPAATLKKIATNADQALSAIALSLNSTTAELLDINPKLAGLAPIIPKGTVILHPGNE